MGENSPVRFTESVASNGVVTGAGSLPKAARPEASCHFLELGRSIHAEPSVVSITGVMSLKPFASTCRSPP